MCGKCRYCVTGRPQLCDQAAKALFTLPDGSVRTRDAAGQPLNVFSGCGVMAEYATLHVDNLVKIGHDVPLDRCALVGCGVMTGVGAACNTARVEPGAIAVVFGAGGVGLNAIQGCALSGAAMIVAVDTSDAKLELARVFGATHTLNVTGEENVVRALRKITGGGADVAFECVGYGAVLAQAYGALRKGGTAVMVGVAGSQGHDDDPHQHADLRGEDADRQLLRLGAAARRLSAPALAVQGRAAQARRTDHPPLPHRRGAAGIRRPGRRAQCARRDHVRLTVQQGDVNEGLDVPGVRPDRLAAHGGRALPRCRSGQGADRREGGGDQLPRRADRAGAVPVQSPSCRSRPAPSWPAWSPPSARVSTNVRAGDHVIALVGHGAFAEECLADAHQVLPLPPGMDFDLGAAFVLTYGTSLHALQRIAKLQAGETVLVLGAAGGVGIAAIEIAKALGARVIAAASSVEKLALCKQVGADETINYADEDLRKRVDALTAGKGADVVYDPVGGPYSEIALRATAWRGRFLVIGFAAGEIPKIPLNLALLKERAILGVFWGDAMRREPAAHLANMKQLGEWFAAGKVRPVVSERIPLGEAGAAIKRLAGRQAMGKLVVLPES